MNYEVIFENKYFKVIRLRYGVLVNIYKCKMTNDLNSYIKNKRKDITKIDDKFYKTNIEIYHNWYKKTYPKDTILYKENSCTYRVIGDILSKDQWYWEIKTTGNCLSGNTEEFKQILDIIDRVIDEE